MRVTGPLAALVLAGLVVVATWPTAAVAARGMPDFGDPLLNAWTLAWVAHAVARDPAHLFDANIFFPETYTLAYSESLLLPGLLLAPLLWAGASPVLAHNLLLLGGYWLSGLATFVLVRRLTSHDGAAIVAGAVFAISPLRIEHVPHVQLQLAVFIPIALIALHALAERPTWRAGVGLGAALAAEMYTCVYLGLFAPVAIGVVAAVLLAAAPGALRGRFVSALALAAAVALTLVWPLASSYRTAARVVGERSVSDVERGSAELQDYRRAHPENALYGDDGHPGEGERRLFPGWTSVALATASVVPPVAAPVAAYAATAIVAADLSLGFNGVGYRFLYDHALPLRALRVPARLGLLVGFALAVLSGFGLARLVRRRTVRAQWLVTLLALGLVTLEGRMRPQTLVELSDPDPAVYRWLATQPRGVVCEYPVGNLEGRLGPQDATYMYYSTRHWLPLVNGYSGFAPPSYLELLDRLRTFPDDEALAYLGERDVTYLLVHGAFYTTGGFDEDVAALRARSDVSWLGAFRWRDGHVTHAFRLPRPSAPDAPGSGAARSPAGVRAP